MFKVLLFRVLSKVLLFWSKVLLFLRMSEHLCLLLSLLLNLVPGDTPLFLLQGPFSFVLLNDKIRIRYLSCGFPSKVFHLSCWFFCQITCPDRISDTHFSYLASPWLGDLGPFWKFMSSPYRLGNHSRSCVNHWTSGCPFHAFLAGYSVTGGV